MNLGTALQTIEVTYHQADDGRLVGNFIDSPRPGTERDGGYLPIWGWALGNHQRVTSVELVYRDAVIRRAELNVPRPDVAEAYPEHPDAASSGFHMKVRFVGAD